MRRTGRKEPPGSEPCSLCGLPVGRWEIRSSDESSPHRFCCPGCMHVFEILTNLPGDPPPDFRETDLYRACVASGFIATPDGNTPAAVATPVPGGETGGPAPAGEDIPALELTLKVEGMWCTACSWLVETVLRRIDGVRGPKVLFFSDLATMKYLPHRVTPEEIAARLAGFGYRAAPFDAPNRGSNEERRLPVRLGISAILTMNIMMVSCALYFGLLEDLGREAVQWFSCILLVLATPVVFYGGLPIFRRAVAGLRYGNVSMDVLISVGALAAYVTSVLRMREGSIHLYFDTAATLVTLVLLGRSIEAHARKRVSGGVSDLFALAGSKVRLRVDGTERWVSADAAKAGDEFSVFAGERSPLDGEVVCGETLVDESVLTGESKPVRRSTGDEVAGGALVLEGPLRLRVIRTGPGGSLNRVLAAVLEALTRKGRIELLSDRITRWLVPAVIILATGTASTLLCEGTPPEEALLRALTVLVITCPCALGIAAPIAKVASIGHARSMGILVRDSSALERARHLDTLVFDKTGTLTEGSFTLVETVTAAGVSSEEALHRVASIEVESRHFLAREILRKARDWGIEPAVATGIEHIEGLGVRGFVPVGETAAGNRRFMESLGIELPEALRVESEAAEAKGATSVFFGWDGEVRGLFLFGDRVRKDARESIARLREKGLGIRMVSGDSMTTVRAVAAELGISDFAGEVFPAGKTIFIRELQESGCRVAMVGDGMNDAAALARADVGCAVGSESIVPQEASDIALLGRNPAGQVEALLHLSSRTYGIIRQNLVFAFAYNLLGIPLAVAGFLNPLLAALAMFASSLTVVLNTLRLSRETPGHGATP